MVVLAAVVGCTSGSDGGVDSRASASGDAGANADTAVVNAVAPYDYDSAIDEAVVQHVLADGLDATVAECVTGKGGVSSYEPVPPPDRDSITDEALADFPNLALLSERGRTLLTTEPPPDISRADYASDAEYADAVMQAAATRVFTQDERDLADDCAAEPDFAEATEPYDLYQGMRNDWAGVLRDIDSADEVDELRDEFRDCVVAGGLTPAPELNEVTFWAYVDSEVLALPDQESMETMNRERGMLFAECGADIYEVKGRLRQEAHDTFVEEHEVDIARLSDYLYGEGLLDAAD